MIEIPRPQPPAAGLWFAQAGVCVVGSTWSSAAQRKRRHYFFSFSKITAILLFRAPSKPAAESEAASIRRPFQPGRRRLNAQDRASRRKRILARLREGLGL
jgi:hypothetical protein